MFVVCVSADAGIITAGRYRFYYAYSILGRQKKWSPPPTQELGFMQFGSVVAALDLRSL